MPKQNSSRPASMDCPRRSSSIRPWSGKPWGSQGTTPSRSRIRQAVASGLCFTRLRREQVAVATRIEDPAFWQQITGLAAGVGAEPMLIVSRQAEGRALRQFVYQLREPPGGLTIERRQDMGNS